MMIKILLKQIYGMTRQLKKNERERIKSWSVGYIT